MFGLLPVVAIVVIVVLNNGTSVRSESPPYCGNSYKATISKCPRDSDNVTISHPFWIENRTSDDDGDCISYPGFQVKCAANGRPVINVSNNIYYVLSIGSYTHTYGSGVGGWLMVVDVDIDAQECPQPRRNISIDSARFLHFYNRRTVDVTFLYNCSRYPQNVVQRVPCLDSYHNNTATPGRRSFALLEEEISSHRFDWNQNCEEVVVVRATYDYGPDPTNYTDVLKRGLYLDWDYPVNCGNCELSGGNCLGNETNQDITTTPIHCNCPHGASRVDGICDTTREQDDPKNSHLRKLEDAYLRFILCKVDLLDY